MAPVTDPLTGLSFFELSHPFQHDMPMLPGYDDVRIWRPVTHAKHGVMSHRIKMQMHTGTHVNAPVHLVQRGVGIGEMSLHHFFGPGVIISLPKDEWETIDAADLKKAADEIQDGDLVIINTGWHRRFADSQEYFGHAPGLSADAAKYLLTRKVAAVGIDTPFIDHPLATSMGDHRNGPQIRRLTDEYHEKTGRSARSDFPQWNPAHKLFLGAGVPTIENVGGDIDLLIGSRCTIHAMPWRWNEGDACMIRLVAITDPRGQYRIESGER